MPLTQTATKMVADKLPKVIDAKTHAILDYSTAAAFFMLGAAFWGRNKRAAVGAMMCGGAIVASSMLTNYPGGVKKVISFQTHGRIDAGLAGLTASMPNVMAFNDEAEAKYFRGAALVETAITGLTDFDSANASAKIVEMQNRTA
jgi:hypothetical protein